MWKLLTDSPARREAYEKVTKANAHSFPYCKTRWCENEQTAERVVEIWPNYQKFVEHFDVLTQAKADEEQQKF